MAPRPRNGGTGHKMLALLELLHGASATLSTSDIAEGFGEHINRTGNYVRYAQRQGFVAAVGHGPSTAADGRGKGPTLWRITAAGERRRIILARLGRHGYERNTELMPIKRRPKRSGQPPAPKPWPLLKLSRLFAVCSFLGAPSEVA